MVKLHNFFLFACHITSEISRFYFLPNHELVISDVGHTTQEGILRGNYMCMNLKLEIN